MVRLMECQMECFIEKAVSEQDVFSDIKVLIPDAGLRRRMSRVIKNAVATAVECVEGVENIGSVDAIITATGWGCLADSEKFLRNMIGDKEQLLNPTPFIQSTFNTVGGQIALLGHNHCYNVTYVSRSHGFEDALLDALMKFSGGKDGKFLVCAFDEQTPSQIRIMERMGVFRKVPCGEGCASVLLAKEKSGRSIARLVKLDFPAASLTKQECFTKYVSSDRATLLYNYTSSVRLFPTASAYDFVKATVLIEEGAEEVIVYNEYLGGTPAVMVLQCIG